MYQIYRAQHGETRTILQHVADVKTRAESVPIRQKIAAESSARSACWPIMYCDNGRVVVGVHLR